MLEEDVKRINTISMVKGEHCYIFVFDEKNFARAVHAFFGYAFNPKYNFDEEDAAVLTGKVLAQSYRNIPGYNS